MEKAFYTVSYVKMKGKVVDRYKTNTKEYPAVKTRKMTIPEVPEGQFIFDLGKIPGFLSVGSQGHFKLREIYGYCPYKISFEKAVQWLNNEYLNTGKKAQLRYCGEWKESDQKMLERLIGYQQTLVDMDDIPIIVEIDVEPAPPTQTDEDKAMVCAALKSFVERGGLDE